eukprot:scaffold114610_cov67-Phaeocystis_antarctica.AAC.1
MASLSLVSSASARLRGESEAGPFEAAMALNDKLEFGKMRGVAIRGIQAAFLLVRLGELRCSHAPLGRQLQNIASSARHAISQSVAARAVLRRAHGGRRERAEHAQDASAGRPERQDAIPCDDRELGRLARGAALLRRSLALARAGRVRAQPRSGGGSHASKVRGGQRHCPVEPARPLLHSAEP